MSNTEKFYQLYLRERVILDDIYDYIEQWHNGDSKEEIYGKSIRDWPESLPTPTDEDIKDQVELSDRNTGSDFFELGIQIKGD